MGHRPHLYLPGPWSGPDLAVDEATRRHLERVLRYPDGAPVDYTDGAGGVGSGTFGGDVVRRGPERVEPAPEPSLWLVVAPPRARERQRWVVEKAAELGVDRLSWLAAAHGVGRSPAPARATAWAVGALEQSRGSRLLAVDGPLGWSDLPPGPLVATVGGRPLREVVIPGPARFVLVVGPEGGWRPGEVPQNASPVGLGPRILRTETAAVVGVTMLAMAVGRLGD